jgi:hypothetical protein
VGRKQERASHKKHVCTILSNENSLLDRALSLSCSPAKLDQGLMETAVEFVQTTALSCRQAASPALHKYLFNSIQIGACIQDNDDAVLVGIVILLDLMAEKRMAAAIHGRSDAKFVTVMGHLREMRFANLVVHGGTVHNLKPLSAF